MIISQLRLVLGTFLLSLPAIGAENSSVPDYIANQAKAMAQKIGGSGITITGVERLMNAPGLKNGTSTSFVTSQGQNRNIVMLPDGEHFLMGPMRELDKLDTLKVVSLHPLEQFPGIVDATELSFLDAKNALRRVIVLSDGQHFFVGPVMKSSDLLPSRLSSSPSQPSLSSPYSRNDILEPMDFTANGLTLFKEPEQAHRIYFDLLGTATDVVVDGNSGPIIYVLFDPSCSYCHNKYNTLRRHIDRGQITVHWIPVFGPSKAPYRALAAISDISVPSDVRLQRLKRLMNRQHLEINIETIDLGPLKKTSALLALLRSHNDAKRSAGTPQTFYQLPNGDIRHHYGFSDFQMQQLIDDLNL